MKQLYILLAIFFVGYSSHAQIIDIPDANFKNALVNTICVDTDGDNSPDADADTNDDGEISFTEAESVIGLHIYNNSISSLEGISAFVNLTDLRCSNNQLTALEVGALINLESLSCSGNQLTELNISNLTNLVYLSCSNNQLSFLDTSTSVNLTYLDCFSNQLNTLNVTSNPSLDVLYCFDNQLTSLDASSLTYISEFDCSNNPNLTTIALADSFDYLTMNYTGLIEVDLSDTFISYLNLRNNANLTYVQLGYLDYYNQHSYTVVDNPVLETISFKNGVTQLSGIDYDSGSYNICNNPSLMYVCADESEIHGYTYINEVMEEVHVEGVQDFVNNCGYTNVVVNSYCSFTPGGEYYTIEGNTILDLDTNGCDENDTIFPYLNLSITGYSDSGSFISNASGYYYIPVSAIYGSHTLTPTLENPDYFSVSPSSITVDFPTDASPYLQDFCITANGAFNDLEISLIPVDEARPGFDANYKLIYKNKGTTVLSGSVNLTYQDNLMDLVSTNPMEDSQSANTLTWNFTDLNPFESREILFTMNINSPMETPPVNGDDILTFDASVNSSETDETPLDNGFMLNQTVVNSFDPNDKTCLEGDVISPDMVGEYVHYRIRFENTGTANAINIVVKDNIDRNRFDLATLVPIDASHDFVARIIDDGSDYYVEFIFENIDLPFDDANNDGYIVFKIKTLDTLVLNDTIENEAEIYFDFNFPIITNTTETTVATLSINDVELADNLILLYPNPTNHSLYIKSRSMVDKLIIYDVSGRRIQEVTIVGDKTNIEMSTEALLAGTYFLNIKTSNGILVKAFIKE